MTPIQRVQAVLAGRRPDRPPISFWYHFPPDQVHGPSAVQAHVNHVESYDLDFLKVMNDNGYPCGARGPDPSLRLGTASHRLETGATRIERIEDLRSVVECSGDEPEFTRQLDLLAHLKGRLGDRVLMSTTIFNAWATLRRLVRPPTKHGPPVIDGADDEVSTQIKSWYAQDAEAVKTALGTIAANQARFARRCIEAGADGIFMSVRDDWLGERKKDVLCGLYDELVRPTDLVILGGACDGRFNLLHICGTPIDLRSFAQYPVHAINWADRAAGPAIADVISWAKEPGWGQPGSDPAICAGIDNQSTLPEGTPEDCQREVADALQQAGDRPILIAPGCTYAPSDVPRANLEAVCRAARHSSYAG